MVLIHRQVLTGDTDTTRLTAVRLVFISITLMLFASIAASAQGSDAKARAREILDQARMALGGDKALNSVWSLSGSGDFRSGSGESEVSGEVQMDLLLPDKLIMTLKWISKQTMKVRRVEVLNGSQVWTDSQMKQPQQTTDDGLIQVGGMGRSGGRNRGARSASGSSGSGKQPRIHESAPELDTDNQQIRSDFSCLLLALLLYSSDLSQAEFSYASEGDINGAKADILKIATKSGLEISLAIDQKTHRPITASYKLPMTDAYGGGRTQGLDKAEKEQAPKSENSEVQLYFSEYKAVALKGFGDVWLPCQISKMRNDRMVEDIHIKKFQLNPHLKPAQFEKKW